MSTFNARASDVLARDPVVVELDVRDDLRNGREPFTRIMKAVDALKAGEVLLLRAIFEPVPLFTVLGKRGFVHEAQEHAPDDWSVYFWREDAVRGAPAAEASADAAATSAAGDDDGRTQWLDVRNLEPPEPLLRTLEALERLPDGHELVHVNQRVPQLLFPVLAERGFACEVNDADPERVLVRIWRT